METFQKGNNLLESLRDLGIADPKVHFLLCDNEGKEKIKIHLPGLNEKEVILVNDIVNHLQEWHARPDDINIEAEFLEGGNFYPARKILSWLRTAINLSLERKYGHPYWYINSDKLFKKLKSYLAFPLSFDVELLIVIDGRRQRI